MGTPPMPPPPPPPLPSPPRLLDYKSISTSRRCTANIKLEFFASRKGQVSEEQHRLEKSRHMETKTTSDCLRDTELRLGLPGSDAPAVAVTRGSKRALPEDDDGGRAKSKSEEEGESDRHGGEAPAAKAQVVGWPPIRSYRRNSFQARKVEAEVAGLYVKVSMDGAPYLRKIDLKVYKGYKELREALDGMFKCFSQVDSSRKEGCNGSEYAMTYEDKDGDLMLVGDVPWDMFICSCKRLRIMKGSEARGLESRH